MLGEASLGPPICSRDGWCWQNPLPQGNELRALWGTGPSHVLAVGVHGTILRFDGRQWHAESSGTTGQFDAVWGTGPTDVVALGDNALLRHYDGKAWTAQIKSPLRNITHVTSFWSDGQGHAVAVGPRAALRLDGTTWAPLGDPGQFSLGYASALWGASPQDLFAVGVSNEVARYDGRTWSSLPLPSDDQFMAIWGTDPSNVFTGGQRGTLLHYDGRQWASERSGGPAIGAMWGVGREIFAVGAQGTILHYNGRGWTTQPSGTQVDLGAVWGSSPNDVFAAGSSGMLLRYNGTRWVEHGSGVRRRLQAVWGAGPETVFAVGEGGTVLRRNGVRWTPEPSATQADLFAVWGSDPSHVFAVGDRGTIVHYDGARWSVQNSDTSVPLNALWGSGPNDVFAAGEEGTIVHYDGTSWASQDSGSQAGLYGLWGSGPSNVLAVGDDFAVLRYDGKRWAAQSIPVIARRPFFLNRLTGIWGSGPDNIIVVGAAVLRYDGHAWSRSSEALGSAVWGTGPNHVVSVGGGYVRRYDGQRWTLEESGADNLAAVWGSGPNDIVAVGDGGAVLHYAGSPAGAGSPVAGAVPVQIELATYCQGNPERATWVTTDGVEAMPATAARDHCYLPTAPWGVDIDVYDLTGCALWPPTALELQMQHPKEFFVRLQGLDPGATIRVEARTELGEVGANFDPLGWGPWRPLITGQVWTGQVLRLARRDVLGDAKFRVELLVQARDTQGSLLGEKLFAIVWPVSC